MKFKNLPDLSFQKIKKDIAVREPLPQSMVSRMRSNDSEVCKDIVAKGLLSERQMADAAERYKLGRSRDGKTVYWMIDEDGIMQDGHVGHQWASVLMREKGVMPKGWFATQCLFGLHLLAARVPVCIVDNERAAVVLSELFPNQTWMAFAEGMIFDIELLVPLFGHQVVLFPRTDSLGDNFLSWMKLSYMVKDTYGIDCKVSNILEAKASEDQKSRGIDILDFIYENSK